MQPHSASNPEREVRDEPQIPLSLKEREYILECERIIAHQVADYLNREKNLSESEDLASAFGLSLLSDVLIALKDPQTPEARNAIEAAYLNLKEPFNYVGLMECVLSLGFIPDDSPLLERVAEHLKKFWPPEDTMDNDDIGDALQFFSQCSIDSVI